MSYFDDVQLKDQVWSFGNGWATVTFVAKDRFIVCYRDDSAAPEEFYKNGISMDCPTDNQTLFWNEFKTPKEAHKKSELIYNDWRLPTIQELLTIVNYEEVKSTGIIDDTYPSFYWSSTTCAGSTSYAWVVYFYNGYSGSDNKTNTRYVRCVRNGKNGLEWSETSKKSMTWDEAIEYAKTLKAPVYWKEE